MWCQVLSPDTTRIRLLLFKNEITEKRENFTMFKSPKLAVLILAVLLPGYVFAGVTYTYNFPVPEITVVDGYAVVTMEECWTTGETGHPALPMYGGKLLLPPGTSGMNISWTAGEAVILGSGYSIEPVQEQHPLSQPGPFPATVPDLIIYSANMAYPGALAGDLQTQYKRGYSIAYFTVRPVEYNPVSGEIAYYSSISVTVETGISPAGQEAFNGLFRGWDNDAAELSGQVDNPGLLAAYPTTDDRDDIVDFLIVTDEELSGSFQELADYKNARGTRTEIITTGTIEANYGGFDLPAKIRSCITAFYVTKSTNYVLLAGDNENVPKRSLYGAMGGEIDADIAADLYYGCLDGNFNADGDQYMGEPNDNPDLTAEVYVGRAAADSPLEAANFIAKQIGYQHTPVTDEVTEGLMLGEDLEWAVWGSAYKEEIRNGASTWGYTTAGFPNWFAVDTLYDYPGFHWSAEGDLLPLLNEGPQLVNHLGHANNTYTLKFSAANINDENCTNNGVNHNYYIIYSQGCYCNSWDNRTPDFGYTGSDAISEKWTTIENGAVCFIGNTRYGWGNYSSTNGASQYGDRQFFDAIFGEGIQEIGRAHQDSKEDCIPFLNNVTYYCYYECGLLGDPSLQIWTATPQPLTVVSSSAISIGDTTYTLEVQGAANAMCAISQNGQLLGSTNSGALGTVTINLSQPISSVDPVRLMVTKPNYLPYDLYLDVYTPNSPNLVFEGCVVDDDDYDGDGILDLGETPYLDLTVTNFGGVDASGVTAEIVSEDLFITIIDGSEAIGNIVHDQTLSITSAFRIEVSPEAADEHPVNFALTLRDEQNQVWEGEFSLTVSAPMVILTNVTIDDGNDQRLMPGETANVSVQISNTGSGEARGVTATIYTDSPYLEITQETGTYPELLSGASGSPAPVFSVIADAGCPLSANIPVYLEIADDMGYIQNTLFEIIIGGIFEDFESGAGDWTHNAVNTGWNDQWTMSTTRNYTLNGASSWHCGPAEGSNYSNHLDAGLLSPEYDILPGATLTFRHWMDAETAQSMPGTCYDGGILEMSLNGSAFMQLYPAGGYNYSIRDYPSDMGPFPAHYQVFSGNIFWQEAVFDLNVFPDGVGVFRFRFGSNGSGTREGWYIDDVEMTYYSPVQPPANFTGFWTDTVTVRLEWNSPGWNPPAVSKSGQRETEALLHYNVYRNEALIAENVQGLYYEDDMRALWTGTYAYAVTAVFNMGESEPTTPVVFEYISAGVTEPEDALPTEFSISANYPNPFNSETVLKYGLPEGSMVKLAIYDLLGREIAVLAEGYQTTGYHRAVWQAGDMPSGIYFYRFEAGKFSQAGKMLLIK